MEVLRVYKDLVVSYWEFEDALLRLGYRQTVRNGWKYYIHDASRCVASNKSTQYTR